MARKQCSHCKGTGKYDSGPTGSFTRQLTECTWCLGRGHVEDKPEETPITPGKIDSTKPSNYNQVGGVHYLTMKIQPWDIIDANELNYYEGNAIKYILRRKGDRIEDLQKAIHYLEHLIELEGTKSVKEKIR